MTEGQCSRCGDRAGHWDALADARCALRAATTAAIREHAKRLDADPVAAADLLAHFRSTLTDDAAYDTAVYVLALGWRPVVGLWVGAPKR